MHNCIARFLQGSSSLLPKAASENKRLSTESETDEQKPELKISQKDVQRSKKVSVILRIERESTTYSSPPLADQSSSPFLTSQSTLSPLPVDKSRSVQFSVLSRSYHQPSVYSSLPQLEQNMRATEVTCLNSDKPARFATLSRTKYRSKRNVSDDRREGGESSIRHSKTFANFQPVPVPTVTLRQISDSENKIQPDSEVTSDF